MSDKQAMGQVIKVGRQDAVLKNSSNKCTEGLSLEDQHTFTSTFTSPTTSQIKSNIKKQLQQQQLQHHQQNFHNQQQILTYNHIHSDKCHNLLLQPTYPPPSTSMIEHQSHASICSHDNAIGCYSDDHPVSISVSAGKSHMYELPKIC